MSRKKAPVAPVKPFHSCAPALQNGTVEVTLVGCGGNGAQMLSKLARLDHALRCTGHPGGIHVTAYDPDTVSQSNIGRQMFAPSDVGLPKACVLVHRLNTFWGLNWVAHPVAFLGRPKDKPPGMVARCRFSEVLISCVDTAKTRRELHEAMAMEVKHSSPVPLYWLDLGNAKSGGQVVLGQPKGSIRSGAVPFDSVPKSLSAREVLDTLRLPCVTDLFPELLDARFKEEDEPSCSLADALSKQSLFVNDHVTDWAMQLLDGLLREGKIEYHGAFLNLETGRVNPLPVLAQRLQGKASKGEL